jgi:hypothetical protein
LAEWKGLVGPAQVAGEDRGTVQVAPSHPDLVLGEAVQDLGLLVQLKGRKELPLGFEEPSAPSQATGHAAPLPKGLEDGLGLFESRPSFVAPPQAIQGAPTTFVTEGGGCVISAFPQDHPGAFEEAYSVSVAGVPEGYLSPRPLAPRGWKLGSSFSEDGRCPGQPLLGQGMLRLVQPPAADYLRAFSPVTVARPGSK